MDEPTILDLESLPNEEIVVSRDHVLMQDHEILGITNQRIIYYGACYPGPSYFSCGAPLENCSSIEYRKRNSVGVVCVGMAMIAAGTWGFFFCKAREWWLGYWPCLTIAFWGLPLLLFLFRLWWQELAFHCGENTVLLLTLSGSKADKESSIKQIREFAENRGVSILNFPAV